MNRWCEKNHTRSTDPDGCEPVWGSNRRWLWMNAVARAREAKGALLATNKRLETEVSRLLRLRESLAARMGDGSNQVVPIAVAEINTAKAGAVLENSDGYPLMRVDGVANLEREISQIDATLTELLDEQDTLKVISDHIQEKIDRFSQRTLHRSVPAMSMAEAGDLVDAVGCQVQLNAAMAVLGQATITRERAYTLLWTPGQRPWGPWVKDSLYA